MKPKTINPILSAAVAATLLCAVGFWAKISMTDTPLRPPLEQSAAPEPAIEAARQLLLTLPATTVRRAMPALPEKP